MNPEVRMPLKAEEGRPVAFRNAGSNPLLRRTFHAEFSAEGTLCLSKNVLTRVNECDYVTISKI